MDRHPKTLLDRWILGLALSAALLHGLVYVFVLPPWQHYDEPNHFKIVALTARLGRTPQPEDSDPQLERQVVVSMIEHGFYDYTGSRPPLPAPNEVVTIPGYPQTGELPLYYAWAAAPVHLLQGRSIEAQLYGARLASLALFVFVVLCAWGAAREVFPPGHAARPLTPLAVALTPGLAELMTAVNNDAMAIAAFSLFAWGALRLLRRGAGALTMVWTAAAAGLAFFAKNTAAPAAALLPVLWLLALVGRRRPGLTAGAFILAALGVGIFAIQPGDARAWLRGPHGLEAGRALRSDAPEGGAVLVAPASKDRHGRPVFYQIVPPQQAQALFGRQATLGVWMWVGDDGLGEASIPTPWLVTASQVFSETAQLTTTPQFFAFTVDVPPGDDRLWVWINPRLGAAGPPRQVYYDGLTLAAGSFPPTEAPVWEDAYAHRGAWGGQPVENLLRNASAEQPAVRANPWLDARLGQVLPDSARPSQLLGALQDWPGTGYYLLPVAKHLFRTFWGSFAWGHVVLIGGWPYRVLELVSALGGLGVVVGWARRRKSAHAAVDLWGRTASELQAGFIFFTLLVLWGLAWVRGLTYLDLPEYYWPTARHAMPAVIFAMAALAFGWVEGWQWVAHERPALRGVGGALFVIFYLGLVGWSVYSISAYYAH